jgi:hypothetical protein
MPTIVNSLRNTLDADANASAINASAILYSTQAEALNSSDQLLIIGEWCSRRRYLQVDGFGDTDEEAGNFVTSSLKDSLGNYPDPFTSFFSAGVQIAFDVGPNPVSNYGKQMGIVTNVGLRHYHHQIQFGLWLDGSVTTTGFLGGTVVTDYMSDGFSANGTILEAGGGNGTWDQNNISLGNLRGINKPVTAVAGTGIGLPITNVLLGDPLNTHGGTLYEDGAMTGYFTEDGIDKIFSNSTNAQNISIGGYGDGM